LSMRIRQVTNTNIEVTSDNKVMRKSSNIRYEGLKIFKNVKEDLIVDLAEVGGR
jgi:hypothetical protein